MGSEDGFYTLKGYGNSAEDGLSPAMEDYLEMISRLSLEGVPVRVGGLSRMLHVRPSSVTKMLSQLQRSGHLRAERYGEIALTERGRAVGDYLLYRHGVIQRFLQALNGSLDELEQAEKIEHFLRRATVENLDRLTERLLKDGPSSGSP